MNTLLEDTAMKTHLYQDDVAMGNWASYHNYVLMTHVSNNRFRSPKPRVSPRLDIKSMRVYYVYNLRM